jgi:hypothetical protein
VPIVLKYGILNLLEPSGPAEACTGIASSYITKSELYATFGLGELVVTAIIKNVATENCVMWVLEIFTTKLKTAPKKHVQNLSSVVREMEMLVGQE